MPCFLDDVPAARAALIEGARGRGLRVLPFRPDSAAVASLELVVESPEELLEAAAALEARALYVTGSWTGPEGETLTAEDVASMREEVPEPGEREDAEEQELARSVHRFLDLIQQYGFPAFDAGFLHQGVLHRARFVDRVAWPAIQSFEEAMAEEDEDDEGMGALANGLLGGNGHDEDAEDGVELSELTPDEGAEEVVRYLLEEGYTEAQMRRAPARLARQAVREICGDPEEHDAEQERRLRAIQRAAEARMRKGAGVASK